MGTVITLFVRAAESKYQPQEPSTDKQLSAEHGHPGDDESPRPQFWLPHEADGQKIFFTGDHEPMPISTNQVTQNLPSLRRSSQ